LVKDSELIESSKYATHLKAWQQTFGKENVRVLLYDDLNENPQFFVDQLTDFIGISRFRLAPSQTSHVHSSEPLTQPRSYYRTRSAGFLADWFKAHRFDRLVAAAKRSPLKTWFLGGGANFTEMDPEVVSNLYEQCRPEVEELENMLGRDLGPWKYQESRMLSAV
jgi:hypothetical protein